MLTTFVTQSGAPLVEVTPESGSRRVRLQQRRYVRLGDTLPESTWKLPVALRYRDAAGVHAWTGELVGPALDVELPGEGAIAWLSQRHILRVLPLVLPPASLEALAGAIGESRRASGHRSGRQPARPASTRLVRGDHYLDVVGRMLADPEPAVARAAAAALEAAGKDLVAAERGRGVLAIPAAPLAARCARLGFHPQPNESQSRRMLRPAGPRLDPAAAAATRRCAPRRAGSQKRCFATRGRSTIRSPRRCSRSGRAERRPWIVGRVPHPLRGRDPRPPTAISTSSRSPVLRSGALARHPRLRAHRQVRPTELPRCSTSSAS